MVDMVTDVMATAMAMVVTMARGGAILVDGIARDGQALLLGHSWD